MRVYIDGFNFTGEPLDVALRRLLLDVGLPRETQQIDRVMEAFAGRYVQCNPDLYISDGKSSCLVDHFSIWTDSSAILDHPYILAFSLIMLHTDAFNKSNKRKMTKADYIKNTKLPGVPTEVLDVSPLVLCLTWYRGELNFETQCFFDNIVFVPFIFIEDPLDVNGQRGVAVEASNRKSTFSSVLSPSSSGSNLLSRGNKLDPYFLITHVGITGR